MTNIPNWLRGNQQFRAAVNQQKRKLHDGQRVEITSVSGSIYANAQQSRVYVRPLGGSSGGSSTILPPIMTAPIKPGAGLMLRPGRVVILREGWDGRLRIEENDAADLEQAGIPVSTTNPIDSRKKYNNLANIVDLSVWPDGGSNGKVRVFPGVYRKPDGTYGYYSGTTSSTTIDVVTGNVPGTETDQRLVCLWLDPSDDTITTTTSSTTSTSTDLKLTPASAFTLINECLLTAPDNAIGLRSVIIFGDTTNITLDNMFHDLRGIVNTAARGNRSAVVTKTADYTTTAQDETVLIDASGGDVTITLVSAVGVKGITPTFKRIDASANTATIDGDGSETIDSETSQTLGYLDSITITSDNSNWWII